MNKSGEVTAIVQNHVKGLSAREGCQGLLDAPVVLLLGLALPGKDGDAGGRDAERKVSSHFSHRGSGQYSRCSSVVLRGENVL